MRCFFSADRQAPPCRWCPRPSLGDWQLAGIGGEGGGGCYPRPPRFIGVLLSRISHESLQAMKFSKMFKEMCPSLTHYITPPPPKPAEPSLHSLSENGSHLTSLRKSLGKGAVQYSRRLVRVRLPRHCGFSVGELCEICGLCAQTDPATCPLHLPLRIRWRG